ncbi:MAG TPA: hypothetical protein VID95_14865 [Candidatus Limnocylindrales bacterium]|jgi:hypothetical protein
MDPRANLRLADTLAADRRRAADRDRLRLSTSRTGTLPAAAPAPATAISRRSLRARLFHVPWGHPAVR